MSKETVIELRIPMPEGRVEEARAIIASDEFEQKVNTLAFETLGANGYTLTSRTSTTRPGAGKVAEGKPDRRRKAVNGAAGQQPAVQ